MNYFILVSGVLKTLDLIHDILCPFFKDDQNDSKKEEILKKLKSLQEELKSLKQNKE